MSILISREDAIEAVKKEIQAFEANYMHGEDDEEYGHDIGFVAGLHTAKTFIRSLPSADAVEVVRCENCIFYEKALSVQGFCHNHESIVYINDFCSYGERRKDGNE